MKKRTFDISFKKSVIEYVEREKCSAYKASKYFSELHDCFYSETMFCNWVKQKENIKATSSNKKRSHGAGRKPTLLNIEDIVADEVVYLRINKYKVTRAFIVDRARMLASCILLNRGLGSISH